MPKITPAKLVERAYAEGRHRYEDGRGYIPFQGEAAKTSIPSPRWETDERNNNPTPQRPADQRASTYSNDVAKGWLRGYGGGKPPNFDSDPAGPPTRKK
jgi:hypothetical protein